MSETSGEPVRGAAEVSTLIRSRLESLSPAEAKVARLALQQPGHVAGSTAMELKRELGVSEATVVRAARSLGFEGYPQLRISMAAVAGEQARDRRDPEQPGVTGDIALDDATDTMITKLAVAEQLAVRETAAQIDAATVDRVADALAAAPRILVFGIGASGLVALDLQEKLARAGFPAQSPAETELAVTSAALMGPGDVAVLVSHRGRQIDTLDVAATVKDAGALTVAVTHGETSPLAQLADEVLVAAGHDLDFRPAALSSRLGHLFVVDVLFVALSQRTWSRTSGALAVTRAAIDARRARRG